MIETVGSKRSVGIRFTPVVTSQTRTNGCIERSLHSNPIDRAHCGRKHRSYLLLELRDRLKVFATIIVPDRVQDPTARIVRGIRS
jgi:hypothetical protein